MAREPLHIVCLDAPAPPDYGGAIDMFYKIKALHEIGKEIILHYFEYNPTRHANGLEEHCSAIYTYPRKNVVRSLPLFHPYIVNSRIQPDLINRLNKVDHPVLLEGLHCSGIVPFLQNRERVVVRMHNDEAAYYHYLAQSEKSLLKRLYFLQESKLLHRYQHRFNKDVRLACLSSSDMRVFEDSYGFHSVSFIPCFIPWQQVCSKEGKGTFCLYHGNLAVSENNEAALWLIESVFSKAGVPFVIAGKGIPKELLKKGKPYAHIRFIDNPSIAEIKQLVREAQINVLPSLNKTGVKLKLLNALLNGRHCITNTNGVKGSRIKVGVHVEDGAEEWIEAILQLMQTNFTSENKEERQAVLALYNNRENAEKLSALWSHYP